MSRIAIYFDGRFSGGSAARRHRRAWEYAVIAGLRDLRDQEFAYDKLVAGGVELARLPATGVDPQARAVTLADGTRLSYDRLVVAPGIDIRWDALPGYGEAAAERGDQAMHRSEAGIGEDDPAPETGQ